MEDRGGRLPLTHASFFSGVGGLDLGLERAGWRTVSFSEIEPYANSILAERWPDVPNLGSIVDLADRELGTGPFADDRDAGGLRLGLEERAGPRRQERELGRIAAAQLHGSDVAGPQPRDRGADDRAGPDWRDATLWSGGFPCQDLSVSGKRRGFAGERSSLAFTFLALVQRYRPPAILLENVPGLLSSHAGRDLGTLLDTLGQLGYGWAFRLLDGQHFGVPQRRRRVFIIAIRLDLDPAGSGPAAVLSVGTRCDRHPPAGVEARPPTAAGAAPRAIVGSLSTDSGKSRQEAYQGHLVHDLVGELSAHDARGLDYRAETGNRIIPVGPEADAARVRAADGLAGRLDDIDELETSDEMMLFSVSPESGQGSDLRAIEVGLVPTLQTEGGTKTERGALVAFSKEGREHHDDGETWGERDVSVTLDSIGHGPRTATAIVGSTVDEDALLPAGLDSHRYRCCGNGVISDVSEWVGVQLKEFFDA